MSESQMLNRVHHMRDQHSTTNHEAATKVNINIIRLKSTQSSESQKNLKCNPYLNNAIRI